MWRGLSFPQKPASSNNRNCLDNAGEKSPTYPTLKQQLQTHLQFPPSASAMGDAGLGCEPLHAVQQCEEELVEPAAGRGISLASGTCSTSGSGSATYKSGGVAGGQMKTPQPKMSLPNHLDEQTIA